MRYVAASVIAALLICGVSSAEEPIPVGEEFQVNSYTTSGQSSADIALDAQGNFVVVWQSDGSSGTDTYNSSIQAQRYDSSGVPVDGQFQVNSYTTSYQYYPQAAVGGQGNFVVVWQSYGSYGTDTSYYSIQAQRYDSSGMPLGGEFQVNSYTTSYQYYPGVAIDGQGNFVVVWQSDGSSGTDTSSASIQAQRYDVSGAPVGGEFQVNSYTTATQLWPAVAVEPSGAFVVVWESDLAAGDPYGWSIQGQLFDSSGGPVGDQFQANSFTLSDQQQADVAMDSLGNFMVVWRSYGSSGTDTSYGSIQGQRYDASGAPVDGQFQVNSYSTSYQYNPEVAIDGQGNFVVVWQSYGSYGTDTSYGSIQGQRYDASGAPVGGEFQVNSYTTSMQVSPAIDADPQGNFVVVWRSNGSYGTDTDSSSVQGQRFAVPGIFTDGFESGDTSAWSRAVP